MHTFDRCVGAPPAAEMTCGDEPPGSVRPPARILVVEDQVLIALSLIADLCALGCDVVGRAASGERAVDVARQTLPDIVLMDVHLAGIIDGVEAAACIQRESGPRIVFITAHADGPDRPRMEALQPAASLGKPYDPEELARIVDLTRREPEPRRDRFASLAR